MPARSDSRAKSASSTIAPARREAFAILLELEKETAHSDDLLRSPRITVLSTQDRNLATTLVMGTLRWQIHLDARIRPLLARPNARLDPEIRTALRLGAFQLLHLDRIPAHAAIGESVALAKSAGHTFASGMVNAVLRKFAAQASAPQSAAASDASLAHPAWLVERWTRNHGASSAQAICEHGQQQPELAIRLGSPEIEEALAAQGIQPAPGAILTSARRVLSGDVTATDAFQTGQIRIQDEGSQLIAELCCGVTHRPTRILDCCAAPGGKTLILAERNPQARITACELSQARFESLRQRLSASAFANQIEFLHADASQLPESTYDLILADVPCSGTGTLGRNPEIRHRLQPGDLVRHHQRQVAILRGALKAAGSHSPDTPPRVIYSTCSLEPEENSQVIVEVLAGAPGWMQISAGEVIHELNEEGRLAVGIENKLRACVTPDGALQLLPGALGSDRPTDGFFAAILEKRS